MQIFVAHVGHEEIMFQKCFLWSKSKKYCNNTAGKSNWFHFAAVFLQHFFAE